MRKISILIAEDHLSIFYAWKIFLDADTRFQVIEHAQNGEEAVQAALSHKPDVILMDIKMPVMDGLEATRIIKNLLPQTKIIGLSACTQPLLVRQFLEMGGASYVSKYAKATELKEAILCTMQDKRWICNHVRERLMAELTLKEDAREHASQLSQRELEIANLVVQGHTSAGISVILGIATRTVEVHRGRIFKKLKIKNRTQLANMLQHTSIVQATAVMYS